MKLAPIVVFTYNRPVHTRQTIEALLNNKYVSESDLIIYSDAPKNNDAVKGVEETRKYIKTITGFNSLTIIERERNYGLANNIIDGVTTIVNEFGRIIVLEDDLITSPFFLKYVNEALTLYEKEEKVISIVSYIYPIKRSLPDTFFIKGADCLGWATWKRGWDLFEPDASKLLAELIKEKRQREFDFGGGYSYTKMLQKQAEGKVGSWAIRWYASAFLKDKLTLYPGRSLIYHNGSDGSGTNCDVSTEFDTKLSSTTIDVFPIELKESSIGKNAIANYFRYTRIIRRIKSIIQKFMKR